MRPNENANLVLAFFRSAEPISGNGWARLAEAHLATGNRAEALAAARGAWVSGDLSQYDEQLIFSRFGSQMTAADHDRRADALLFDKRASDAYRMLPYVTPMRRGAFGARIAMQSRSADADQRYQAVIGQVTSDAGLMMDRARYLRDRGYGQARARPVRPIAQFHLQAGRSGPFPRYDGAAGQGRRRRSPVADRLQHRQPSRRCLHVRRGHQPQKL